MNRYSNKAYVKGSDRDAVCQKYLDEVLALVERTGSIREMNLRAISRNLGFAHTNAYNYFESIDELLWQALVVATERLMEHTNLAMQQVRNKNNLLEIFIGSQVDFALAHAGWYRFIWLEALQGPPPPAIASKLRRPGEGFNQVLIEFSGLPPPAAAQVGNIIHGYLHGALCKAVTGRAGTINPTEFRKNIVNDVTCIFKSLVEQMNRRSAERATR